MVAIFAHQIQYEYYVGNQYVYIEGIATEHFSAPPQTKSSGTPKERTRHAVLHSFLSNDIKQDAATNTSYSKHIIQFLKQ